MTDDPAADLRHRIETLEAAHRRAAWRRIESSPGSAAEQVHARDMQTYADQLGIVRAQLDRLTHRN